MRTQAPPANVEFVRGSAAVSIEGSYDPTREAALSGVVTINFTARLAGTDDNPLNRLRDAEGLIAAEVLRRLRTFDTLVAERDSLLIERTKTMDRPTSSGFSTAEIMFVER
jgi:hypothetical protein